MTTFDICLIVILVACSAFHLWCSIDFHRKKNRLDIAALEKRPLISDENSATLRSGDVLLMKVPVYADEHMQKALKMHADSLEKRGIKAYVFSDNRSKYTQFFVLDQQALNAK